MRKILNLSVLIFSALILFSSCKKDESQMQVTQGKFQAPGLTTYVLSVALTSAAENDTALRFKWSPADFGQSPVITYTFQVDKSGDISGDNAWSNAVSINLDKDQFQYAFTGKYLNSLVSGLGLPGGAAHDIVFRITAAVNQSNGTPSTLKTIASNTVMVSVTTYELNLYVPGAYQGWDPASAPVIAPVKNSPGQFEGYVNITGTGEQHFKYTNAPDWNHINYGDGGGGTFSTNGSAGDLVVPGPGYYELTADLNSNRWTATQTTWAIIGDATPGGWGADTQMAYDPATQVWTVTANMLQNGSFKFRANNQWSIDFGVDANSNLKYADNPFFAYNSTLSNLTVPEDGNYTITLDLHVSGEYNYILHKN